MSARTTQRIVLGACVGLVGLLASTAPAYAWRHLDPPLIWLPDDFPLKYWVADDGQIGSPEQCEASDGMEACCEESLPTTGDEVPGYCRTVVAEGFAAWKEGAPCAEFSVADQGLSKNIATAIDNKYQVSFNDPGDQNAPGTAAVTYSYGSDIVATIDGIGYAHFDGTDIIVSKEVEFTTHESIERGECSGNLTNLRGVLTHEIGHSLGMGHACEDPNKPEQGGGPCTDPTFRAATMYWQADPCSNEADSINEDDIQGFTALYGPFATFTCSHQITDSLSVGVVPFDLNCVIVSDFLGEVTSAEWNFGDGGTSEELRPSHTYTEPGNYTIQLDVHGEREACGAEGWTNSYHKIGYVRACGVPQASFSMEHVDGLKYRMLNDSDVSVYGCLSNIEWQVFEGDKTSGNPVVEGITAWEPVIEFPDSGTYTVVMNLGGIAGTGAAKLTTDIRDYRGEGRGCSTTGAGELSFGILIALGAIARRRR